jgi:hypothetical protein
LDGVQQVRSIVRSIVRSMLRSMARNKARSAGGLQSEGHNLR